MTTEIMEIVACADVRRPPEPMCTGMLYLSGPMRGLPRHNAPAFREAATRLRNMGYRVCSPVELDEMDCIDPEADVVESQVQHMLRRDIRVLIDMCDSICLLPGHSRSEGAQLEHAIARAIGLKVYRYCQSPDGKVWLEVQA